MSNYFFHPLGDYAQNYINNSASPSEKPHTYIDHGWNKVDFGVGGEHPVYSMTNGTVTSCGWFGDDGISKNGVVIRTSDCGYSRMMAKIKGGSAEQYPIYFTYIEMDSLNTDLQVGMSIKKGTMIGMTNSDYAGSNLHFDIQPYDRYSGDNIGNANKWYGCISLSRNDAYGDKGASYDFKDHLDSQFSIDKKGNLKDSTGKYIGLESNGIYYPPDASGNIVNYNTNFVGMTNEEVQWIGGDSTQINKWYAYAILMQTPVKLENSNFNILILPEGWHPSDDTTDSGISGYFSTGKYTYPIYVQNGGPWANIKYWDGTFTNDACNITTLATLISGITGTSITPLYVKEIAYKWAGIESDEDMDHQKGQNIINNLPTIFELLNVSVKSSFSAEDAKQHLKSGKPVEVSVSGYYGAGTTINGHFISFLAYNEKDDTVFIGDSFPQKGSGWYPWSDATATSFWYILVE